MVKNAGKMKKNLVAITVVAGLFNPPEERVRGNQTKKYWAN